MKKWLGPICAATLVVGIVSEVSAAQGDKPVKAPRVYGPAAPAAPRVYGPREAPVVAKHGASPTAKAPAAVTDKVASSTESTKPPNRGESAAAAAKGAQPDPAHAEARSRSITIYFVQGEEKQSIVEFALPVAGGQAAGSTLQRAMTFEANNIEADVDGKLLLRGDVRIRFANGLRLGAQLVAVTTSRDEGPVEIVVKE